MVEDRQQARQLIYNFRYICGHARWPRNSALQILIGQSAAGPNGRLEITDHAALVAKPTEGQLTGP